MFKIGDKLTKENYVNAAIWCNTNNCRITSDWIIEEVSAPSKESLQDQVRNIRNELLKSTDIYMLSDYSLEDSEKENYKNYRQYLRDYPTLKNWYKENPLSFEEWKKLPVITKEKTIQDEIDEYQKYLDETDWYALRQMETRKATPYAVLIKRNEARDKISELRNKLKEGKE